MPQTPRIPIPRQWNRLVKSAALHAVSLAHYAIVITRSNAANSWNARIRLQAENDRLGQEVALLTEEMRIKDGRTRQMPAQRRPHYLPVERLAILELRAARGWSMAQTARRMLVATATIASWTGRLDEDGQRALVRTRHPVNRFPDFVRHIVQSLKVLCPSMGKVKIAQVLCRAGLHLAPSTVSRMLQPRPPRRWQRQQFSTTDRVVTARRPNEVWHADLTTVPTSLGFWCSWLPQSFPPRTPFCWWVAVAIDHYSRRIMRITVFDKHPTSVEVRQFLGQAIRRAGVGPKHLITDRGSQFTDGAFARWCGRRGIRQRFGAVGKYGSIAVIERLIRTLKTECTRRLMVSYRRTSIRDELTLFVDWYNSERPHVALDGATPGEIYGRSPAACRAGRYEPRRRWPRGSPCAVPRTAVRGRRGIRLELDVEFKAGRKHLPLVSLKRAA